MSPLLTSPFRQEWVIFVRRHYVAVTLELTFESARLAGC